MTDEMYPQVIQAEHRELVERAAKQRYDGPADFASRLLSIAQTILAYQSMLDAEAKHERAT